MGGLDVFVVGAGNSAGQAVAHPAGAGAQVTVLVRAASPTAVYSRPTTTGFSSPAATSRTSARELALKLAPEAGAGVA